MSNEMPLGHVGFQKRGEPETFFTYNFDALSITPDGLTIGRPGLDAIVFKLDEIERLRIETSADFRSQHRLALER